MAVFGSGSSRIGGGRGPSFGVRFFCYAVICVALMFYDRKGGWLDTARYGLQAAIYPLQLAVNSPSAAWRWLAESFATRESLQKEVDTLRMQLRDQQLVTIRQAALERENATLRGLNETQPEVIDKRLVGEVISVETSTLRQRLVVNRGGNAGVHRGQPVITGEGVLGQVFRIGPFSSEVILITDAEHALPVQVARSGVRTIALGTGHSTTLDLPYVPQNYDVKPGDLLVTSGLGEIFPYGLPVGRVTKVTRDPAEPLARISAVPLARIDADREVLFIWGRPGHPAAAANPDALVFDAPPAPGANAAGNSDAKSATTPAKKPANSPAATPIHKPAASAPAPAPATTPATTPAPAPANEPVTDEPPPNPPPNPPPTPPPGTPP